MHCLMKVQHLLIQQTLKNVEHDRQLAPPLVFNEGNARELKFKSPLPLFTLFIQSRKGYVLQDFRKLGMGMEIIVKGVF